MQITLSSMLQSQPAKERDLWWNASNVEGTRKQASNEREFRKGRRGQGEHESQSEVSEMSLKFPPGSLYSKVQLTLAPCVSSAVKGDVLGGRSGSMMLITRGCGSLWQNSTLRGSGTGALSFTSVRTRRRVPVPVASGEPKRACRGCTTAQGL